MKTFILGSLFLATAFAASETLSTIQSTIISSLPCSSESAQVAPTQFFYANVSTFAPLSTTYSVVDVSSQESSSSKAKSTKYEYDTAYNTDVFEVTRTVCDNNNYCYLTTDLESSTTYTTTVDGILTVITTAVPVSASTTGSNSAIAHTSTKSSVQNTVVETSSTVSSTSAIARTSTKSSVQNTVVETSSTVSQVEKTSEPSVTDAPTTKTHETTTVITITSCEHNKCSKVPRTTGLTVITVTSDDMVTAYTTFCPLSETPTSAETTESTLVTSETSSTAATTETSSTDVPQPQVESTKASVETPTETPAEASVETSVETPVETPVVHVETHQTVSSSTVIPSAVLSTVNVITNNILTQTPEATTVSQQTTSAEHSSSLQVSTFEGAANSVARSTGMAAIFISFALMLI